MDSRDDAVALLAHELRNLLAPIRYALASLEKTETTPQQSYALEVMRRQSAQMSRLLDDLLDVSRFARGEFELRAAVTDLVAVLRASLEAARPVLDAKQHVVSVTMPQDPVEIWADPLRLQQVFSNLLINAAKYTDHGGRIELQLSNESETAVIRVRDSGIGISATMMPRIFLLFAQDAEARGRSEGGLGIGLALVHGIVGLHDGTIDVQSEGAGRGSEFVVRLPSRMPCVARTGAEGIENPTGTNRLKVLVVDDNQDVADTCAMLVEMSGHRVETVYSAKQGLERAAVFLPDVILTDIGLPDLDGYRFAEQVRATSWGASTVLVAISGWGEGDNRPTSSKSLFSHHLMKPIDPETIESLLSRLVIER